MKRKGFTLVELIVVLVIIGILALLGVPKYLSYSKEAELTRIKSDISVLESASNVYYMRNDAWPRLSDIPYTHLELTSYADDIYDKTGFKVDLDLEGDYYGIDYVGLQNYVVLPTNSINYILQNPVGNVYYLKDLSDEGKEKLSKPVELEESKPNIDDLIPEGSRILQLNFSGKTNSDSDRGTILDSSGSGSGYNGTLVSFDYNSKSGWTDNGLLFGGTDYVRIPSTIHTKLRATNQITLSATLTRDVWGKQLSYAKESIISTAHYGGWDLHIYGGSLGVMLHTGSEYKELNVPSSLFTPGGTHTITSTFDGRYLKLFVDGVLHGSLDAGATAKIRYDYTNAVLIGADGGNGTTPDSTPYYLTGVVNNIEIYNMALSEEVIKLKDSK